MLEGTVDSYYGVGDPEWDSLGLRGLDAGLNLKSTSGWISGGNGTDLYGFSALSTGYRNANTNFDAMGRRTDFWSSVEFNSSSAWTRHLAYHISGIGRYNHLDKESGFSVRCLKDN